MLRTQLEETIIIGFENHLSVNNKNKILLIFSDILDLGKSAVMELDEPI